MCSKPCWYPRDFRQLFRWKLTVLLTISDDVIRKENMQSFVHLNDNEMECNLSELVKMEYNPSGQGGWRMQRLHMHRNPPFNVSRLLLTEQQGDMSLNFSHSFPLPCKTEDGFITKITGNVEWTVKFTSLKSKKAEIVISSKPIGEKTCPLAPWTVTFDVWVYKICSVTGYWFGQEQSLEDRKDVVISKEMDYVSWEYPVLPSDKSFVIEISNIRIKGVHKFEMKNFDSADANEDLVLDVNGVKLHCHSPILSWNSEIFRAMIEESEVSSEICLKDKIPVEDLRELLHYLYLPCEPVDDHNFRQLLHWGHKFEVKHVVQLCQHYMESLVLGPSISDAIRIEIFLLSWRYSVEHLKNIYAKKETRFVSSDWMMKVFECELYKKMDKDMKLQMWEFLVQTHKC